MMSDAFPMIEQCMRQQSDYYSYLACVTCGHEVRRSDDHFIFNCGWCQTQGITPLWLKPKLIDGQVVVEKEEGWVLTVDI